ncbi:hypothetical protein A4R43_15055 [Amycolatopsis albispora]|uniref:Orc1-like AAA ATPase domain-containing protein n=1 Tax=Amycolatopsis albispora TaxID=1804986 RepID=A0A344L6L3_9PSEU|nr:hypothetical protein A4R43_15055 [Amycolatopsis albispora]
MTGSAEHAGELLVGRDDQLERLLNLLAPTERNPGPVVVAGMGGIGKTTLSSHTASVAADRGWFPGGVLFVDLRGYDLDNHQVQPERVFASMLRILAPDDQVPATVDEQAAAYHQVLSRLATQRRRVLLVLDNAATSTQIADLVPRAGLHRTLITSRDTLSLPGAHQFNLDVMHAHDALQLLSAILTRRRPGDRRTASEPDAAKRLAVTTCGALPLAVEITASVLADEPDLSITDLIAELETVGGTGVHRLPAGERTVGAVIDQSWHRLRTRHPDAARLLPLLTLNPGSDFHTDAAAALAGHPPAATVSWLRTLRHASLLRRTESGRWTMHDLIRNHARDHLHHSDTPDPNTATQRLLDHYEQTTKAADRHLRDLAGDLEFERFTRREDALAWLDAERANLVAAVGLALTGRQHDLTTRLAAALDEYLHWRHHVSDRLTVSEYSLIAAQHLNIPRTLAASLNYSGLALRGARWFGEAITALQKARDLYGELGDRHGEGRAWNNLGNVLRQVRRFDEAITAHQNHLKICRELNDHHAEGVACNNLGSALQEVRRFDEAITAHQKARDLFQKLGDRHAEGRAWNNLGNALQEVRRFDEAITAHQKARDLFQKLGDRHAEGRAWNNLGNALQEVRRFDEAITAHQNHLKICRELNDHHAEGVARNNLGNALRQVRRFDDAITACQKARDLFQELGDRRGEGGSWNNLGSALQEVRRFDEAITAHQKARDLYRELGDRHAEGRAWNNLGNALRQVRRFNEAITAHQNHLKICRELNDHHAEGVAWNNLGLAQRDSGRPEEAKAAGTEAISAFRMAGDAHNENAVNGWLNELS